MKKKGLAAKIMLSCGALLIGLVVAELLVRLWWDGREAELIAEWLRENEGGRSVVLRDADDPMLGYELVPGATGFAWGSKIRVNSSGLRGPEVSRTKDREFRLAILGDSVAFGTYLPEEATFAARLRAAADASGGRFDVLNFAVGGYDVLQYLAVARSKLPAFDPDLVLISFCLNDVGIVSINQNYVELSQSFLNSPLANSWLARYLYSIWGKRQLTNTQLQANDEREFARRFSAQIDSIGAEDEKTLRLMRSFAAQKHVFGWYASTARIGRMRYAFREIAELAEQQGYSVALMIVPWLDYGRNRYRHRAAHELVTLEAQRVGFSVIDPLEDFLAIESGLLKVRAPDNVHPNGKGHEILAANIESYLRATYPRLFGP